MPTLKRLGLGASAESAKTEERFLASLGMTGRFCDERWNDDPGARIETGAPPVRRCGTVRPASEGGPYKTHCFKTL